MRFRLGWSGFAASFLLFAPGCGSGEPRLVDGGVFGAADASGATAEAANALPVLTPLPALPESLGRIVVTPAAALFAKLGDRATLKAEVFDASGQKLATTVTWESSRAGVVAVDANGQVTAMVSVGSSQIRARAGALVSPPVMIVVAEPAASAVLVSDAQITVGPSAIALDVPTGVGSQVALSVTGVPALVPGTLLLASEGKPVAGRVVSATPAVGQDQLDVVLELIPLLDLFKRLNVDSSYDIDAVAMAQALATSSTPSPLPLRRLGQPPEIESTIRAIRPAEFMLGPFKCEAKLIGGALTGTATVDLRPTMTFSHRFIRDEDSGDWTELMAKLEGSLTVTSAIEVNFSPMLAGSASCEAIVVKIPVPVAGALSALIRFEIPLSVAGEIGGALSILSLKAGVELKGETKIALGFRYTPQTGTTDLGAYSNKTELKPTFTVPGGEVPNTSLTASVAFGGAAGLNIGALVGSLSLLKASLMLKAELKAGPIRNGLVFTGAYDLKPTVEAGAGSDVEKAMRWFGGLVSVKPAITLTLPVIAQSPRGKFTADKKTVKPNQPVNLSVDLLPESLTFLGIDNVVDVRIYRPHRTDVGFELVATMSGAPGKASFTHTFTPTYLDAAAGKVTFWAGVSTRLLPGLALEVNELSQLEVKVGDGASRWKGTVTVTCSTDRTDALNGDTFSDKLSATVELEHLTEQDALLANAKATGTAKASKKWTHDFKAGTPDCPVDVHEETIGLGTEFLPVLFQTKFHDDTGNYELMGAATIKGTQHLVHTETASCKPVSTRTDPDSPYSETTGYDIQGKVEPDATSFSGTKNFPDEDGSCDWTWSFGRL